jgi:fused-like protein
LVILKAKLDEDSRIDVVKNNLIPNLLINHLKTLYKMDLIRSHRELFSELIVTLGTVAKATFDKRVGIEAIYIKNFFNLA